MNSDTAKTVRLVATILILGGILLLAYGGYVYASEKSERVDVVPGEVPLQDRGASLPIGAGFASLAAGIVLLFIPTHDDPHRTVGQVRPPQ
jgi:TRAP-type C4-dicarboxylate transport system permease small subunit